jgi:5-phospho-D-xylono-1,4-lactonase
MGRRRRDLAMLSKAAGVKILSATGRHRRALYEPGARILAATEDELMDSFVSDLDQDCGLIKIATGWWSLDDHERTNLAAAAGAHAITGAPIAVHLEGGTSADVVLADLSDRGVASTSVILGHLTRYPEPAYLREVASSGAYLCLDGPSPANHHTDWRTLDTFAMLAGAGHGHQLLLGDDTTTDVMRNVNGGPGMRNLLTRTARRLEAEIGTSAINDILVENPKRAWAIRSRSPTSP